MSEYADSFWKHLIPVLTNEKANIIVPLRVYEEVEKYANDVELCKRKAPDNPNLNQAAKHAKEKIIKYQAEGIVRVLGDKNDNFADNGLNGIDATQLPKTFAEFLQLQIDRKREFDRLPVEIKQKFSNDVSQYMATAGSEEWFDKLGIDFKTPAADQKEQPAPAPADT